MKRLILLIALLAAGFPAVAAFAHAFLDHAVPAVGSTVTTAPKEVLIFYTQPLESAFSGAVLLGANGQTIATAAASWTTESQIAVSTPSNASVSARIACSTSGS